METDIFIKWDFYFWGGDEYVYKKAERKSGNGQGNLERTGKFQKNLEIVI